MRKQDQAARIAEKIRDAISSFYPTIESGDKAVDRHASRIRRAITAAVRKERERCLAAVDAEAVAAMTEKRFVNPGNIITDIIGGKRGKA